MFQTEFTLELFSLFSFLFQFNQPDLPNRTFALGVPSCSPLASQREPIFDEKAAYCLGVRLFLLGRGGTLACSPQTATRPKDLCRC